MHPNPAFRQEPNAMNLALCLRRGFGILCVNGEPAPMISHVPFFLDEAGTTAEIHLVRSNPIARKVQQPTPAVIAVNGPDGYVSPDWYDAPDQVPTWNYVAVHLRGVVHPMEADVMRAHLDRLSAQFEARLAPKRPWTTDKMSGEALERMMRQVLPFRFEVQDVDGTWKLGQNKPELGPRRRGGGDQAKPDRP